MATIIDFHAHIGRGIPGTSDRLQRDISPQMVLEPAREAGVDRTVVFPVTYLAGAYPGANREVAEAVAAAPERLTGFARLHPLAGDASAQLTDAVARLGLKGLKLHHGCDSFPIAHPRVGDLLGLAGDLGIPVIFHSGGIVPELIDWARTFPQTQLVFGHMGALWAWDDASTCVSAAAQLPNIWLEASAVLVVAAVREAVQRGPERVLFDSDAPAMHPAVELEKIRVLHLSAEVAAMALGGNAARLLRLAG
jgi:predicted TIM-barrel fold metal-dependent hydrolase